MDTDSPIFVTGVPRSGTTFVQHLLTRHPRITIHGQEPANVCWGDWLLTLKAGADSARRSNRELDYEVPHYAGDGDSGAVDRPFLSFIKWYLIGQPRTPRWGVKSLTQCRLPVEPIRTVWPETRWVVCLRDPFRALESLRSTFDRDHHVSPGEFCDWWVAAAEFASTEPSARLLLFDRLPTPEARHQEIAALFDFLGEDYPADVRRFVKEWPVVHQVIPHSQRTYRLSDSDRTDLLRTHSTFGEWADRLGYA